MPAYLINEKFDMPKKKSPRYEAEVTRLRNEAYDLLCRCEVGHHVQFVGPEYSRELIWSYCRSKAVGNRKFAVCKIDTEYWGAWRVA